MDEELDRFKRIDLPEYAASRGYHLVGREPTRSGGWRCSTRTSLVMRHPITDDKIVLRIDSDGHWTYFSVRDGRDNGTIVDFLQRRGCFTLGAVREELRVWSGTERRAAVKTASLGRDAVTRTLSTGHGVDRCAAGLLALYALHARTASPRLELKVGQQRSHIDLDQPCALAEASAFGPTGIPLQVLAVKQGDRVLAFSYGLPIGRKPYGDHAVERYIEPLVDGEARVIHDKLRQRFE